MSPTFNTIIRDGGDSLVEQYFISEGLSKEFSSEVVKCAKDSTYIPQQIFN